MISPRQRFGDALDCEAGVIGQHQRPASLRMLWLQGSKSLLEESLHGRAELFLQYAHKKK